MQFLIFLYYVCVYEHTGGSAELYVTQSFLSTERPHFHQ